MYDPFDACDWPLAHGRRLSLGPRGLLMAIVNVTPDSFSDGGRYAHIDAAIAFARRCLAEGAEIIDVGGESTRPGADAVTPAEEQDRVLPVIEALARDTDAVLSVDTYRSETARLAIAAGAHIINDVHGLQRDADIASVAAVSGAGLCMMHTGRGRRKLPDVIEDQALFLDQSLALADAAGIEPARIVLDPGFGFAKDHAENFALMARFGELHRFGRPLLAGTSRKRFLGAATGRDTGERDAATAASTALLRTAGAAIFRVHNVAINRDALTLADAMLEARRNFSLKDGRT